MRSWFRKNKNINKEKTAQTELIQNSQLEELRNTQITIKEYEQRIRSLKDTSFPVVTWWIIRCGRIPTECLINSYLIGHGCLDIICSDSNFDIDQFFSELKLLFKTYNEIKELNKQICCLKKTEKQLKEKLGII